MAKWQEVVATVAPGLATALGGPLAGLAVGAIGKVFGLDSATQEQVATAISGASPSDLLALKQAEYDFQKHMADLGVDIERISAGDRDSARQREAVTRDWTPKILAFVIMGSFVGMTYSVLYGQAKADSALVGTLIGYLSAKAEQVVAYYFGSSSSSEKKNQVIARMAA